MDEKFDALRLVYFPSVENKIAEFLQVVRGHADGNAVDSADKDKYVPIILDVALRIRATVADTDREIKSGDTIKLAHASSSAANSSPPSQGQHGDAVLVNTDEWGELFKPQASIHIGSDVELTCLECMLTTYWHRLCKVNIFLHGRWLECPALIRTVLLKI